MRILKWLLIIIAVLIVVLVGAVILLYSAVTRGPLPQIDGELKVAGLRDRVEVIRDPHGVPHIYASSPYDLFFAQGFTHAQDRWWQMEFSRATGDGRLQELTGKNASLMSSDIYIRSEGWRRAAERDIAEAYDDETLVLLQAFADGVNAYITSRAKEDLALEYRLLGVTGVNITVRPWTPADTVVWQKVMAFNLSNNNDDLDRARQIEAIGADAYAALVPAFQYDMMPTIIDPADLPEVEGETFAPTAAPLQPVVAAPAERQLAGNYQPIPASLRESLGSNNWAVSGDRTVSGKPLLADDPHLSIQMPSIWYEIGLHCQPVSDACPYDVVGFALPAFPGIVIGHNGQIGWAFTNVGHDVVDYYRINVNPDNPLQYEYNGEWRDMVVHDEVINFGDGEPSITIQVRETHFGPIVNDNRLDDNGVSRGFNTDDPVAMRWTALDPSQTLKAIFMMNAASNWDEFREAVSYFDAPSQNLVYADIDGNIGYQMPGLAPVRPAISDGLLPVDGSTDAYEWLGYIPFDELPSVFNPSSGYIQSANQAVVPESFYDGLAARLAPEFGDEINVVIDTEWALGFRGKRIDEMLAASDQHTVETFKQIQSDNKSLYAEAIMPAVLAADYGSADLNAIRDWLGQWDFQMSAASGQAAFFAQFLTAMLQETFTDQSGEDYTPGTAQVLALVVEIDNAGYMYWDDAATADTVETRDDIVKRAFVLAHQRTVAALGADRAAWQWGKLHIANFVSNPMGASGIDLIENMFNRSTEGVSGGPEIVNATGYNVGAGDFPLSSLPSLRMIVDFSDLDASQSMHTTGQSAHPFSDYYANLIPLWTGLDYKPMLFTRGAVDAAAKHRLTLTP